MTTTYERPCSCDWNECVTCDYCIHLLDMAEEVFAMFPDFRPGGDALEWLMEHLHKSALEFIASRDGE